MKRALSSPRSGEALSTSLRWYGATAAAGALAAAPAADAQVVYTDVNPDVTLSAAPSGGDETFPIDFDGDGDPELILTEDAALNGAPSNYIAGFADDATTGSGPDVQVAVVSRAMSGYQYFLPLPAGHTISAGNVNTTAAFTYGPTFTFQGADPNGWTGAGEKYAGIQFTLDPEGTTHFGWILLEIPQAGTVTIKGYAYETNPDTPIQAGATTSSTEPGPGGTPRTHALSAVFPNPFAGRAAFTVEVAETQPVRVEVYDALGQRVEVLHDGALAAGEAHRLVLDGGSLASGVYVVRVTGERFTDARAVTLTR